MCGDGPEGGMSWYIKLSSCQASGKTSIAAVLDDDFSRSIRIGSPDPVARILLRCR